VPFAALDDVMLFYTDEGAQTVQPVLLVHGWACDSHDWMWQFPALLEAYRVIAVDLRGHGQSTVTAGGYTPHQFAADLAVLLDAVDAGPVVAVGHSLGAIVVNTLAVEHSAAVAGVVAIDPGYGVDASRRPAIEETVRALSEEDPVVVASRFFAGLYVAQTAAFLPVWHRRRIAGMQPHVIRDSYINLVRGEGAWVWRPTADAFLARRRCPALVVARDSERVSLEIELGSTVVVWERAGHFLHQERPAEFNRLLLGWLAEHPRS
jgi:pimeloyl-ACP methyl ester carboxylesterase